MRHFEINDAEKPITVGELTFEFRKVEYFQGKVYGIFQTDDEEIAAALETPEARKLGVRPMSAEDYAKKAKKKILRSANISLITSKPRRRPQPEPDEGRVVAAKPETAEAEEPVTAGDIRLEDVLTPKGEDGSEEVAQSDEEVEAEKIRARLEELGEKTPHPMTGIKKLRERLTKAEAKNSGGANR